MKKFDLSLYLVTDSDICRGRDLASLVKSAVKGGVTIVQLREKEACTADFLELAKSLKTVLQEYNVPLIINDRLDIALAVDADGVHIGQSDMPYDVARRMLGHDKIIGLSVESMEDVAAANKLDVDYIGVSPIFSTPTKTNTKEPFGLDGTALAFKNSKHRIVAIGGINASNIKEVMNTGIEGVAVVSAILAADDVERAARELVELMKK